MTDAATMERPVGRTASRKVDRSAHEREFKEADEAFQEQVKERIAAALFGVSPREILHVYVSRTDGVRRIQLSGMLTSFYRKQRSVEATKVLVGGNDRVCTQQLLVSTLSWNREDLPPRRASNTHS